MTLPLLVSLVGLTSCALVVSINFLTFTRTNRLTISKRIDLILIFARCLLDIFVGFAVIIYIAVIVLKTLNFNKVTTSTTYFVVFSSLPSVFFWPTRFVLSICISTWRILVLPDGSRTLSFCSSVAPFNLFLIPVACPSDAWLAPVSSLTPRITDPLSPIPETLLKVCIQILFSVTFVCAAVYAIMICFCETRECREKRIVETDYWFLLCMFITTLFDCIPFAITIFGAADFGYNRFGPFINTLNMVGACFDAVVVSKIFETHQFF